MRIMKSKLPKKHTLGDRTETLNEMGSTETVFKANKLVRNTILKAVLNLGHILSYLP
jgi:hypothetical protein